VAGLLALVLLAAWRRRTATVSERDG
jgi:MYXO-CTERM domain-containing protein